MKPDLEPASGRHPRFRPETAGILLLLFILIFILLFAFILPAVRTFREPEPPLVTEEPRILLPVIIGGGDASWENCVRQTAADYMLEHPEVQIKVKTTLNVGNVDYARGLIIEEALGNFNGIVEMRTAELYVKEGRLAPIPESLANRFRQVTAYKGQVYTLPRYYSCRGIIYNRRIFEQYGIQIPQTYQEFLEVCRTLKSHGIAPLTIGAGDLWHLNHWSGGLFNNHVLSSNPDWIRQRSQGLVHWTDEEPLAMLRDFQTLFQQGYVAPDFAATTDAQTIELLTGEKAAMLYSGTWLFSQILKTDPQFDLGWFFLPNDHTEPAAELNGAWEWAITSSCVENGLYDTAVDFLEYYYSHDAYQTVLQSMNGFSSLKETIDYPAIPVQEEITRIIEARGVIPSASLETGQTPGGFLNMLHMNLLRMAQGTQTPEETAIILDKEWDKRIGTEP